MIGKLPRRYGVKVQHTSQTEVDHAAERLALTGFSVIDGGYSADQQKAISDAFELSRTRQAEQHGGYETLREIDEHNTIRAPLLYDSTFLELAMNPHVLALADRVFGGSHERGGFVLNQQNGIINPANATEYNQGSWHRDLPYQHFVSSRPLAINALYCIDAFTTENGATLVVPGSHRQEEFPSDKILLECQTAVTAEAGCYLVLDCMTFHSGGINRTNRDRRAVNHIYTMPFIKQQILLPRCLAVGVALTPGEARLLGYGHEPADSPADYYQSRRSRLGS